MDLVTAQPVPAPSLTGLIERARTTLAEARGAAEILEVLGARQPSPTTLQSPLRGLEEPSKRTTR